MHSRIKQLRKYIVACPFGVTVRYNGSGVWFTPPKGTVWKDVGANVDMMFSDVSSPRSLFENKHVLEW